MSKFVIHRDSTKEVFQTEKIVKAIKDIIEPLKLEDPFVPMFKIIKNFELKLPDEIKTDEIDRLLLKAMEGLISEDLIYDQIATAQFAKIINKTAQARFNTFKEYIEYGVEQKLLREEMLDFNIDELEWNMNYDRDYVFTFFGIASFEKKYQLRDYEQKALEKVQRTWMRMAMGLAFLQEDRNEFAIKIYNQLSQLKYLHSHSYNSWSPRSQMSSCFISTVEDNMEHIMEKATELAQLSKFDGGMGISFTKLRASGSLIKKINQLSSGPIPFMKIYDTIKSAMLQGTGKKRSALVFYMEPRHFNIGEFLDTKENNGNDYLRLRTCNTALWIPDEFMKRIENKEDRYLFDPNECQELGETWGEEREKHYHHYIKKAEAGDIKLFKKMPATELYNEIMVRLAKSGNFWINFKDTHNRTNQAPSYGHIHSSNLCTEISIPNNASSTAVCTLASANLMRTVDKMRYEKLSDEERNAMSVEEKMEKLIKRDELKETVEIAIQALDNIVDFNFFPYPDTEKNSKDLRPLGLGVMGYADILIHFGIAYDSPEALVVADTFGQFMYATALEKSKKLAAERGPFRDYDADKYDYEPRRNILLLAVAPTASIAALAGVSSGIDSNFGMVFSRELRIGKFTYIVKGLVEELKRKGLWNEDIKNKIVEWGGSIQHITELDGKINKDLFRTAYEYSPTAQIDIAAAWQKHIDQAISRNLYYKEEERGNIGEYYLYAWKQGLKATYYCFIQKTIQGEKYTQKVNKRAGRKGFGAKKGFGKVSATPRAIDETQDKGETSKSTMKNDIEQVTNKLKNINIQQVSTEDKVLIEKKIRLEKGDDYVEKLKSGKLYDGNCPVDPFEAVMCEGCQ